MSTNFENRQLFVLEKGIQIDCSQNRELACQQVFQRAIDKAGRWPYPIAELE